jgi:hypothetical protein
LELNTGHPKGSSFDGLSAFLGSTVRTNWWSFLRLVRVSFFAANDPADSHAAIRSFEMKQYANMCDAWQALVSGELLWGDRFTAANHPGRVWLVFAPNKVREVTS